MAAAELDTGEAASVLEDIAGAGDVVSYEDDTGAAELDTGEDTIEPVDDVAEADAVTEASDTELYVGIA